MPAWYDFRPHEKPRVGVCVHCGREVVQHPRGLQDVEGFLQCRPRGQQYLAAPLIDGKPRRHALALPLPS